MKATVELRLSETRFNQILFNIWLTVLPSTKFTYHGVNVDTSRLIMYHNSLFESNWLHAIISLSIAFYRTVLQGGYLPEKYQPNVNTVISITIGINNQFLSAKIVR